MLRLETMRAKKGDCLLLHYGTEEKPRLCLIDGGPAGVWRQYLQPRLLQLAEQRAPERLKVDLMVVSHIDDDHINGLIELTEQLKGRQSVADLLLDVRVLWHNTFDDVFGEAGEMATSASLGTTGEVALEHFPKIPSA